MNNEQRAILEDIERECYYLARRHRTAGNEVLAAIVGNVYFTDCEDWGIPTEQARAAFEESFPTLTLYN